MAQAFYVSNTAVSATLGNTGGISNSASSFFVTGSSPVGYPSQFPFRIVFAKGTATEEIVTVTSGSGTSGTPWQITRGQDGTTQQAQSQGATVDHMVTAGDINNSYIHAALGSGSSPHGLPASAWTSGTFNVINETVVPNNTTSTITWSSIPGTYSHLLIVVQGRLNETTLQSDDVWLTINGDSSLVYAYLTDYVTNIKGSGTSALTYGRYATHAVTAWPIIRISASLSGTAVNSGGGWCVLPNYANSTFNKMFVSQSGAGSGSGAMVDGRTRWGWYNPASQSSINSLTLACPGSSEFLQGSFAGLYGLGG